MSVALSIIFYEFVMYGGMVLAVISLIILCAILFLKKLSVKLKKVLGLVLLGLLLLLLVSVIFRLRYGSYGPCNVVFGVDDLQKTLPDLINQGL